MEILKFDDFVNEDHKVKINEDYNEIDDNDIDEGMNNIFNKFAGLFSAPNQQDPKTKKDWTELVTKYLDKIETKEPLVIAVKLRNMMTEYINGTGYFVKRTGTKFPKQLPHIIKGGIEKITVDKDTSKPKVDKLKGDKSKGDDPRSIKGFFKDVVS